MHKKGVISLETLVKFIPAVIISIAALYVLFTLWGAFFAEEASIPQNDLVRVANNIRSLAPGEDVKVFTKGKEYYMVLYASGNSEPRCGQKACACVQEFNPAKKSYFTTRCEIFSSDNCAKAATNPGFICIRAMPPVKIENIDQEKQIDFLVISRSKDGIITMKKSEEFV